MVGKLARGLVAAFALSLIAAACSSSSGSSGTTGGGGGSSSLNISGSSTVEPITSLVAQNYQSQNAGVDIAVDGPGTTDGFVAFCQGETDINDASRVISDDEKAACAQGGVDYIQLEIGLDALTVVGNPNNSIDCLSFPDLYALFGPESDGFQNWSDANSLDKEVGGKGTFPDLDLTIVAPGEESGTFGSFIDLAIKDIAESRSQEGTLRPDYQASGDDNVIIDNAESSDGALGFVGFAYAQNAGGKVKEFEVDGGDGCVAPGVDTVHEGTYPLGRSLYLYVSKEALSTNSALKPFVDYYLSDAGTAAVTQAQYIALPGSRLKDTRATWSSTG